MTDTAHSFGAALERLLDAVKNGTIAEGEVEYVATTGGTLGPNGTEARLSVIVHREPQKITWPEAQGFAQGGMVPRRPA